MTRPAEERGRGELNKIDWNRVETDFLATGLPYSRLAKKHGISLSSLKRKAAAEHWQDKLRKLTQMEAEIVEPGELAQELREKRREQLQETADRMLEKIRRSVERLDPEDAFALASLVRALKDLRELQGLRKDALDLAEQQARIDKLRCESRRGESGAEEGAGVLILPAIEEIEDSDAES